MKKILSLLLAVAVVFSLAGFTGMDNTAKKETEVKPEEAKTVEEAPEEVLPEDAGAEEEAEPGEKAAVKIVLGNSRITVDGAKAGSDTENAVFTSNDVIYYEDKDSYESGNAYGEGAKTDRHTEREAKKITVLNITEPGTYEISGKLAAGQIRVDLGAGAKTNPEAVVKLVLNNAEIKCNVAPAILFLNVYECDSAATPADAKAEVDTSAAGAVIELADGSTNKIEGSHVAKIFKDTKDGGKLWKQDGAVYSYMSMNVQGGEEGTGKMNIKADNEGLDTERHLTVNGGVINIFSQNDGINTNEDGVSVTTVNGGSLHILAGLGEEGDGIDSNGWLVINGGMVVSMANPASDAGLDSDMGSYINGGTVVALGSVMDWPESESGQVTVNLRFADFREADEAIVFQDAEGKVVFAYDPSDDEVASTQIRTFMGAVISCPEFKQGETYSLFMGGKLKGEDTMGVYSSVEEYTGGVQQAYTGTSVKGGPEGGKPGPEGGKPGDMRPFGKPDGEKDKTPPAKPEKGKDEGKIVGDPKKDNNGGKFSFSFDFGNGETFGGTGTINEDGIYFDWDDDDFDDWSGELEDWDYYGSEDDWYGSEDDWLNGYWDSFGEEDYGEDYDDWSFDWSNFNWDDFLSFWSNAMKPAPEEGGKPAEESEAEPSCDFVMTDTVNSFSGVAAYVPAEEEPAAEETPAEEKAPADLEEAPAAETPADDEDGKKKPPVETPDPLLSGPQQMI